MAPQQLRGGKTSIPVRYTDTMNTTTIRSRIPALLVSVGLLAAIAGCGGDGTASPVPTTGAPVAPATASPSPTAPAPSPSTATPATPAPTATPVPTADRPDLAAVGITVETAVAGFDQPVFVTAAGDGSGRLFVVEQGGRIRIVRDGRILATPFLDISGRVLAGGERGLLGLAFPPGFGPGRPTFYVHHSDARGDTTVSEFRVSSANPDVAEPGSERIVLTVKQPYANHNGGWIGFDADGMLLIGLGDGGSGGDPENRASDLGSLLGKMLRIDVRSTLGGGLPYAIPPDNPFVGRTGARPEILHYGLRNPFRDSIDPATGDLWIGDVGQNAWEEIDVARAGSSGLDFGWRRWEGRHCYNPSSGCDPTGVTMPVTEYPHPTGCSVIGGVVYRGAVIPPLRGAYLFSDYCSGTLWAIDAGLDARQAPITLAETGRQVSSIGTDETGEVYLTDLADGQLLRVIPGG
jgi:glucose/arabinose dehydrogenase